MGKYASGRASDFGGINIEERRGDSLNGIRFDSDRDDPTDSGDVILYRGSGSTLKFWNGSSSTTLGSAGGLVNFSLNDAYDDGSSITVDNGGIVLAGASEATGVLQITADASSTGVGILITNSGSGNDITGTSSTWGITAAGVLTATGLTMGDDEAITLGASSDAVIQWVGSGSVLDIAGATNFDGNMTIEAGHSLTIAGTAGSTVGTVTAGDLVVSDGSFSITDADNAETVTIINNTATTIGAAASAGVLQIESTSLTTGAAVNVQLTEGTLNGGFYYSAWDATGGARVWSVGEDGATVLAGKAAGTTVLTLTLGDLVVEDSDGSKFESEDGTATLLTLDNKAGVIASDSAVLLLDAGGAVASGGNILRVAPTGTPNAGAIGIEFVGAGKLLNAMYIDADPTGSDVVTINGGGALTNDNAVLVVSSDGNLASGGNTFRVETTGTPASGAVYAEFDFAGVTDTNENVGVLIDAGGKKVQALSIDADPEAGSVALIHTDGPTADNKAVLELTSAGTPAAAGSNVLRVAFTGTATNKPTLVEVIGAGKDCKALDIDADPTAADVVYIHSDAVIADNKALMSLHSAGATAAGSSVLRLAQAGTPAAATSYTMEIDNSGMTATNNPVCVRIDNGGSTAAVIQATTSGASAPVLDLYNTNAGATGVVIKTTHTSASPADNDVVSSLQFWGVDDTGSEEFGRIETMILDATSATSASSMKFYIDVAGTAELAMTIKTDSAVVGSGADHAVVTSNGAYNLTLSTNEGTDSGTIVITDGANGAITLTPNGSGIVDVAGAPVFSETESIGAGVGGAINVTAAISELATDAGGDAFTLADGTEGQIKFILLKTDGGGDAVITPAHPGGYATITMADAGDTVLLLFTNSAWYVIGNNGSTLG